MSENIKITINIAGRNYPLIANHDEVDQIRELEKSLKAQYLSVSKAYPKLETQDHLAIILLTTSRAMNEDNVKETKDSDVQSIIDKIENHLE